MFFQFSSLQLRNRVGQAGPRCRLRLLRGRQEGGDLHEEDLLGAQGPHTGRGALPQLLEEEFQVWPRKEEEN